jgi:tetratricopeptide (TPR) repeat protein
LREGLGPQADEPEAPELDPKQPLPRAMRAELKGLQPETAAVVAAHLVAAGQLIDTDPELAYRHAEAARRRATRLPIVREATAEAAYAAGLFEEALAQFRVLRRMTGSPDFLPVMADCLRALGQPRDALALVDEGLAEIQDPAMAVEIRIVQAGARADLGQVDEAGRLLRRLIEKPPAGTPGPALARAWYAWASHELEAGHAEDAHRGFERAAKLDPAGQTDALDRLDALDGLVLELDEDDIFGEDEEPEDEEPQEAEEPQDEEPQEAEEPEDEEPEVDEAEDSVAGEILRFAQDDREGAQDDREGAQDDREGAQDDRGGSSDQDDLGLDEGDLGLDELLDGEVEALALAEAEADFAAEMAAEGEFLDEAEGPAEPPTKPKKPKQAKQAAPKAKAGTQQAEPARDVEPVQEALDLALPGLGEADR